MLCAGARTPTGGKDTCQGRQRAGRSRSTLDAGAPQLRKLAGIVSAGNGCGLPGVPAIYDHATAAPAIQALGGRRRSGRGAGAAGGERRP